MFNLKKIFKEKREKSALPLRLEEFLRKNKAFFVRLDGSRIFSYQSVEQLLEKNSQQCALLLKFSSLDKDVFDSIVLPFIKRFISYVGVLPASNFHHDCDCGGLLRHSLNVAIASINQVLVDDRKIKESLSYFRSLCAALIFLSFLHDLGKIITDYEVFDLSEKESWQPLKESLDSFCQRLELDYVVIKNKPQKLNKHEDLLSLVSNLLFNLNDPFLDLISKNIELSSLNFTGELFLKVKMADRTACKLHGSAMQNLFYVQDYIKAYLITSLNQKEYSFNEISSDIYICEQGALIVRGSPFYELFKKDFESIVLGQEYEGQKYSHFQDLMRLYGIFTPFGYKRLYNWYRVILGDDVLYIQALLISFPQSHNVLPCVNTVILGTSCIGLGDALKEQNIFDENSIVKVRVINGVYLNRIALKDLDLNSIRCIEENKTDDKELLKKLHRIQDNYLNNPEDFLNPPEQNNREDIESRGEERSSCDIYKFENLDFTLDKKERIARIRQYAFFEGKDNPYLDIKPFIPDCILKLKSLLDKEA